jgi:hypothetical protein
MDISSEHMSEEELSGLVYLGPGPSHGSNMTSAEQLWFLVGLVIWSIYLRSTSQYSFFFQ